MSRPFSDILGELGAGETCDVPTDVMMAQPPA